MLTEVEHERRPSTAAAVDADVGDDLAAEIALGVALIAVPAHTGPIHRPNREGRAPAPVVGGPRPRRRHD